MAYPLDADDFDFDEFGIYREKAPGSTGSADQGISVELHELDDDGIWRDDNDDGQHSHFSFRTFQTDSGVGHEQKSSTNSLNKLPEGVASPNDFLGEKIDEDDYQLDEKSINISELETSISGHGAPYSPFGGLGSDDGLDLPELNDESYQNMTSDPSSRKDSKATSVMTDDAFENKDNKIGSDESDISDIEELGQSSLVERNLDLIMGTYTKSSGRKLQSPSLNGHSSGMNIQSSGSSRGQSPAVRRTPAALEEEDEYADEIGEVLGDLPPSKGLPIGNAITAGSIFTQEDAPPENLSQHGNKSLMEFLHLEAAVQDKDDGMDLIGQYLQGLEDDDGEVSDRDKSPDHRDKQRSQDLMHNHDTDYDSDMMKSTGPSELSSGGFASSIPFVEEQSLITNQEPPFGESLGLSSLEMSGMGRDNKGNMEKSSPEKRPATPTQIPMWRNRSPYMRRPGSSRPDSRPDSRIGSRSSSRMDSRPESKLDSRPVSRLDSRPDSRMSMSDSVNGYNDAKNMYSNVKKGYIDSRDESPDHSPDSRYSRPESRNHRSGNDSYDSSPDYRSPEMASSRPDSRGLPANRPESPSRIPMFRNRSPSMSRPGSSLNGSRTGSPDRQLQSSQSPRRLMQPQARGRRALPMTPVRNRSSSGSQGRRSPTPDSGGSDYHGSRRRSGSLGSPDRHPYVSGDSEEDQRPRSKSDPVEREVPPAPSKNATAPAMVSVQTPPQVFKIRQGPSAGSQHNKLQPMKAKPVEALMSQDSDVTTPRHELKQKFMAEQEQRQMNEETLHSLQTEYNSLLKRYALAENTIDELRLGAKVALYSDSPVPGNAAPGVVLQGPQQVQISSIGPSRGTASIISNVSSTGPKTATLGVMQGTLGSRPGSRGSNRPGLSITSAGASTSIPASPITTPGGASDSNIESELNRSIADDGVKLSLLVRAKEVEEQTTAFQVLLDEHHLDLSDQEKALSNIKSGLERLQQDYRDARENHEYLRRQGLTSGEPAAIFDEEKEVEGELYKLSMRVDDLEHKVQGNLKTKTTRVPFKGAVKADHGLMNGADGTHGRSLSPRRPPSVGSITGAEVDEQLHQLTKDYNSLMDRYRQLKQMKNTPGRDEEINTLLVQLKDIYEQTPEHRKPPLPPELENQYSVVRGSFVPPEMLKDDSYTADEVFADPSGPIRYKETRRKESSSTAVESDRDSRSRKDGWNRYGDTHSSKVEDRSSSSSGSRRRRGVLPDRPEKQSHYRYGDAEDSSDSHRSSRSGRRLPQTSFSRSGSAGLDKDSGYAGSKSSVLPGRGDSLNTSRISSGHHPASPGRRLRDGMGVDARMGDESDHTSSGSADSVIERRIRSPMKGKDGTSGRSASESGGGHRTTFADRLQRSRSHGHDSTSEDLHQGQMMYKPLPAEQVGTLSNGTSLQSLHASQNGIPAFEPLPQIHDPNIHQHHQQQHQQQQHQNQQQHTRSSRYQQQPPPNTPMHPAAHQAQMQAPPHQGQYMVDSRGRTIHPRAHDYQRYEQDPSHGQSGPTQEDHYQTDSTPRASERGYLEDGSVSGTGSAPPSHRDEHYPGRRGANETTHRVDPIHDQQRRGYHQPDGYEPLTNSYQPPASGNQQGQNGYHQSAYPLQNGHQRQQHPRRDGRTDNGYIDSGRDDRYHQRETSPGRNVYASHHPQSSYRGPGQRSGYRDGYDDDDARNDWDQRTYPDAESDYRTRSDIRSNPYLDQSVDSRDLDSSYDVLPRDQYRRDYQSRPRDSTYGGEVDTRGRSREYRRHKSRHGYDADHPDSKPFERYGYQSDPDPDYREPSRSRDDSQSRKRGSSRNRRKEASEERKSKLRDYYLPKSRAAAADDYEQGYDEPTAQQPYQGHPGYRQQHPYDYAERNGNTNSGYYDNTYSGDRNGYNGYGDRDATHTGGYGANAYSDGYSASTYPPADYSYAHPTSQHYTNPTTPPAAQQYYPAPVQQVQSYASYPTTRSAYEASGAAQPGPVSYQVLPTTQPCPMCGGGGYHTHGEYVHNAASGASAASPTIQAGTVVQPGGASAAANSSIVQLQPGTAVYLLPGNNTSNGKVRYYVREYGTDSDAEVPFTILKSSSTPKKPKMFVIESESDEESEEDLNQSLTKAIKTACKLKKMSRSMKTSLKAELKE